MIGLALIAGAALLLGAGIGIHAYWNHIINWIVKAAKKIQEVLKIKTEGCLTFLKRINGHYKNLSEHYSKVNSNQWRKDTVIEQNYIDENDVPEEIRLSLQQATGIEGELIDISNHVEKKALELQNS